jgi:hypothetical protein
VKKTGYFSYENQGYFLSEAFADKTIALRPSASRDGIVHIYFREFKVADLSLRERAIVSRRVYLREGDPRNRLDSSTNCL